MGGCPLTPAHATSLATLSSSYSLHLGPSGLLCSSLNRARLFVHRAFALAVGSIWEALVPHAPALPSVAQVSAQRLLLSSPSHAI